MKARMKMVFDQSKKKKGIEKFVFLVLLFMISNTLCSCKGTTAKEETLSCEASANVISESWDTSIDPETAVSEEALIPHVFEVKDLLEMRRNKRQISDYYITNTGTPSNLFTIDEKNVLWGCGYNECGQLGLGTQSEEMNSEMVKIAENVVHVEYSQTGYTVFLTKDHKLYGMGTNATGALLEDIPVSMEEAYSNKRSYVVTSPKLLMEDVCYVSLGRDDVVVMKTDHTVWTWGERWYRGRIYKLTLCDYDREPVKLLENAKLITGGVFNHAALLTDGTLWTWGYNFTGNCGIDGEYFISEPQKVARDVKMVWTGRLAYNVNTTDIIGFNNTYEGMLEDTIIEKTDGSFFACGANVGTIEKTLDFYYEVGEPYTIICSSEFLPCVILETGADSFLGDTEEEEEDEIHYNVDDYGTLEESKQEYKKTNSEDLCNGILNL